ncbi:hypothetical protein GMDG_03961 [Pseudogymnoascus destructans 20631-21]|uniref:Major facilitator superfamily (MFS) profile domain-containing protein n=1 Tax=Pseudogymnoascus destructans (strain ATCC MYA-4855 / 20631-21) TaxID=658429 RepID=L8G8H7_PSED2|nr:hypothetical protein GMDG_03961 [Pseudogymnoascus destructans 20631-21]
MPPAFGVITGQWYRHAEQPVRIAAWYGTNASQQLSQQVFHSDSPMFPAAPLSHGRFVTASFVYWRLENDVKTARFLTGHQRAQAIERLRANNTGIGSREFNWSQVIEVFLDPKTYLWFALTLLLNVGAAVTNVFDPLILGGLGMDKSIPSLLNMPFSRATSLDCAREEEGCEWEAGETYGSVYDGPL